MAETRKHLDAMMREAEEAGLYDKPEITLPADPETTGTAHDCADPEACYMDQLLADRDAGWKEAESQRARADRLEAENQRLREAVQASALVYVRAIEALSRQSGASGG